MTIILTLLSEFSYRTVTRLDGMPPW